MKNIICLLFAILFLSCSVPDNETPNVGISSNPNFISGTVVTENNLPLENAIVSLSDNIVILYDTTDEDGKYDIKIDEQSIYSMKIIFDNEIVFVQDSVTFDSHDDEPIIITDIKVSAVDTVDTTISLGIKNKNDTSKAASEKKPNLLPEARVNIFDLDTDSTQILNYDKIDDATIQFEKAVDNSKLNSIQKGRDDSLILGHLNKNEMNYRMFIKFDTIEKEREFSKVYLTYSIRATMNLNESDSVCFYRVLTKWSETEITASFPQYNYQWSRPGVLIDGKDVAKKVFHKSAIITNISNGKLILDVTKLYKKWQDEENSLGFMITLAEDKSGSDKYIVLNSSESQRCPVLQFVK